MAAVHFVHSSLCTEIAKQRFRACLSRVIAQKQRENTSRRQQVNSNLKFKIPPPEAACNLIGKKESLCPMTSSLIIHCLHGAVYFIAVHYIITCNVFFFLIKRKIIFAALLHLIHGIIRTDNQLFQIFRILGVCSNSDTAAYF